MHCKLIYPWKSIFKINNNLEKISKNISKRFPQYSAQIIKSKTANINKIIVKGSKGAVKIEPNELLRGSVFSPIEKKLKKEIAEIFNLYPTAKILDNSDLYGGKICAALDRQHPIIYQKR